MSAACRECGHDLDRHDSKLGCLTEKGSSGSGSVADAVFCRCIATRKPTDVGTQEALDAVEALIAKARKWVAYADEGRGHIEVFSDAWMHNTIIRELAALDASDWLAARDAAVRAEALREAAANWPIEVNKETLRRECAATLRNAPAPYTVDQWLRDRAERGGQR